MIATAIVQPVMYVWDARWVAHERLHLADIERSVRLYLEELGRHRFESESDCRRAADTNGGGFAAQMDIFAAASNELRHSKYAARDHVAPAHQRARK